MDSDESLCIAATTHVGMELSPIEWLSGGDEAQVLRVRGSENDYAIHVSPCWRTKEQLLRSHAVALQAAQSINEVVAPLSVQGTTTFQWGSCQVAIYPYVNGHTLDRNNPTLRVRAAQVLARIHSALLVSDSTANSEYHPEPYQGNLPTTITDNELDSWWSDHSRGLRSSMTHGDYYRGNLLCNNGKIVGVIDWHESRCQPLAHELAGATFELCKDSNNLLNFDRAREFVAAYFTAEGPTPMEDVRYFIPLLRHWIQDDIVASLHAGNGVEDEYVARQIRTFEALRSQRWCPFVNGNRQKQKNAN